MEALDGNAIAGALFEIFGREMTIATGACRTCAAQAVVAELEVYSRAPGTVARCRHCGSVVMVLVSIAGTMHADMAGFDLLDSARDPDGCPPSQSGSGA